MKLPKSVILITAWLLILPVWADTPFEDEVPLELVRALLSSNGATGVRIYADILDEFPDLELPADFEVLGSTNLGRSQNVMLRTQLPEDTATLALTTDFESEGYTAVTISGSPGRDTGFVIPARSMGTPTLFCQNDIQQFQMRLADKGVYNLVFLVKSSYSGQQPCSEIAAQQEQMQFRMNRNVGVQRHMPRLEVPQDPSVRNLGSCGGMSSSNNEAEGRCSLNIDWDLEPLHQHFANQLQNDDWQLDTEAQGDSSANSVWLKSPEEGVALLGSLTVIDSGDSDYELRFSVRALGEQGGRQGVFFN